ncbi:lipopolysaccharide assembly protein LapA domain-containing protein [Candidatus Nitrospira salsa]|nr:MAG: hypothetical protein NPIRA01_16030 [Nitrospirales bacterium]
MTQSKLIAILTLLGCVIIFAVQNYEVVELRFLFWQLDMSRALLLFFVFGGGVMTGWLLRGGKK